MGVLVASFWLHAEMFLYDSEILWTRTNAKDTRFRNRRQKTGVGFWRQFFTPVAKFLAPETNMDE